MSYKIVLYLTGYFFARLSSFYGGTGLEQGRVAGANMAGVSEKFKTIVPSNRLKVAGIDLASAGDIDPDNLLKSEIEESDGIYRKIVKKNNKIVGCIMLGSTAGFLDSVKQIAGNTN